MWIWVFIAHESPITKFLKCSMHLSRQHLYKRACMKRPNKTWSVYHHENPVHHTSVINNWWIFSKVNLSTWKSALYTLLSLLLLLKNNSLKFSNFYGQRWIFFLFLGCISIFTFLTTLLLLFIVSCERFVFLCSHKLSYLDSNLLTSVMFPYRNIN